MKELLDVSLGHAELPCSEQRSYLEGGLVVVHQAQKVAKDRLGHGCTSEVGSEYITEDCT
jgi:hypothetical protein